MEAPTHRSSRRRLTSRTILPPGHDFTPERLSRAGNQRFPSSSGAHHRLLPHIVEKRIGSQNAAAHAAEVDTRVRNAVLEYVVRVDPAVAGHHRFRDALRSPQILAPD